jgi:uncharacterized protein YbjT (DUF2867 family)
MASSERLCVVTGAFGHTGRYSAQMLLNRGVRVRTLTNHPRTPDPFGGAVEIRSHHFSRPDELRESRHAARA